jgi:hypothetical protein
MRVEIHGPDVVKASQDVTLRVLLFNDSYEPVAVSRNAFVGPNLRAVVPARHPYPESVEPTFGGQDEPLTLQPFSFYGRERSYSGLEPGEFEVAAEYRYPDRQTGLTAAKRLRVERN